MARASTGTKRRPEASDVVDETAPAPRIADDVQDLLARHRRLAQIRSGYEQVWQRIVALVWPHGSSPNSFPTPGAAVRTEVLDATPEDACEMAAAGLHALLTNPATRWFELGVLDEQIARDTEAGAWLWRATNAVFACLSHPSVRFQIALDQHYADLLAMASGGIYVEDRPGNLPLVRAVPLSQLYWCENEDGEVDTVHRLYRESARNIARKWGRDRLPDDVKAALERDGGYDEFAVLHIVEPRTQRAYGKRDRANMPWRVVYLLVDQAVILEDGGVPEFPWSCPRWRTKAGEVYGRGPGHKALAASDVLQRQQRANLLAGERALDPAMMAPDDGVEGDIDLRGGRITTVRAEYMERGITPRPLLGNYVPRVDIALEQIQDTREQVRMAFLKALLQLIRDPRATATHVIALEEEAKRGLSPILARLEAELVAPLIGRVFAILQRMGVIEEIAGPAPPELVGRTIKPEFQSPAKRAQRLAEAGAIPKALELLKPLLDLMPQLLDNIDADEAVRIVLTALGVPAVVIRSLDKVQARRAQQEEDAQAKAGLDQFKDATVGLKNIAPLAGVDVKAMDVMSRIAGGMGGGAAAPVAEAA